jgi:hypothetical protein
VRLRRGALPHGTRRLFPAAAASALGSRTLVSAHDAAALCPASAPPLRLSGLPAGILRGGESAARNALLVGFEPTTILLQILRGRFSATALFFADTAASGDVIAVALRPGAREPRAALRLPLAACAQPASASSSGSGSGAVCFNADEFAAELAALGAGLVESVEAPPAVAAAAAAAKTPKSAAKTAKAGKRARAAEADADAEAPAPRVKSGKKAAAAAAAAAAVAPVRKRAKGAAH